MVEEAPEGGFVAPFLSASNSEPRTHNSELGEAVDSELPPVSRPSRPSHQFNIQHLTFPIRPAPPASPGNLSPQPRGDSSVGIAEEEQRSVRNRKEKG